MNGIVDPTTEGANGDFYLNTTSQKLFGPKTNGSWSNGFSLVGAQGQAGTNGVDGKTILNGIVDPTTEGANGDFYLNTTSQKLFGPKTQAGWGNGVSLIGSGGGWGLSGNTGTDETANFIGTTDAKSLNFRVNNEKAGAIELTNASTFFGHKAGNSNTNLGIGNTAFGFHALLTNTNGNANSAFGSNALRINSTGVLNTALGNQSLFLNTSGSFNTAVGVSSLGGNITGHRNTSIGQGALGFNESGTDNTAIGYRAEVGANNLINATAIGANAIVNASNTIQLGDGNVTQVIAGTGNNTTLVAGGLQITGGSPAVGKVLTSDANGVATWQSQTGGGWGLSGNAGTDPATNFIGTTDAQPLNFRVNNENAGKIYGGNIFLGRLAGNANTTGAINTAIGASALESNTSGGQNTAIGWRSMYMNISGIENTAVGALALRNNLSSRNTAIGSNALQSNVSGAANVGLGEYALVANTTGSLNTGLGYHSNVASNNLTNATAIGANAVVNESNSIQLGDGNVTQVFAGTGTNATIITGGLKITGGTPATGKVLTSDADGLATWQPQTGGGWGLSGNAGTDPATNFIGTTDAKSLNFRVNNEKAGRIESGINSNLFFGYQSGNGPYVGSANTGIGHGTFYSSQGGGFNVAIGNRSLYFNTTGSINTAIGTISLHNNIDGGLNVAVGYASLVGNKSGGSNAALGYFAMGFNTTGYYNTAVGSQALQNNTTGNSNTALGYKADMSINSLVNATAIGANAIVNESNTIQLGDVNVTQVLAGYGTNATLVAGGLQIKGGSPASGKVLTSDDKGFATWQTPTGAWGISGNAGTDETTNFIGTTDAKALNFKVNNEKAGRIEFGKTSNTFFGFQSGTSNQGNNNIGIGYTALYSNTVGGGNTAIGAESLNSNSTGDNNTAVGKKTLGENGTGSYNTALGYQADVGAKDLVNATSIGANAIVNASNNMVFGDAKVVGWGFGTSPTAGADAIRVGTNASNGNGATLSVGGTWTNTSDKNKKENFAAIDGLDLLVKITQLPITRWNYKGELASVTHIGPMAQDFFKLFQVGNDNKSISTIDPSGIALAAIQQLIKENEELKETIKSLTRKNNELQLKSEAKQSELDERLKKIEDMMTIRSSK